MSERHERPESAAPAPNGVLRLDRFVPYRLSVLSNTVSGVIARLYAERFGLTIAEWRTMAVLGQSRGLSANAVADRTRMDKVRVSRAVRGLTDKGLVVRRTDGADRRRSVLRLDRRGEAVYRQIVPLALGAEADLLEALSPTEAAALDALLAKLQRHADRLAGQECRPAAADPAQSARLP